MSMRPLLSDLRGRDDETVVAFDSRDLLRVSVINESNSCKLVLKGVAVFEGHCLHNEKQARRMAQKAGDLEKE